MELLNKLCMFNACSGNEGELAEFIVNEISGYADEVSRDALGNIIAKKHGSGKTLMFLTHMDSCGFFTTVSKENKNMVSAVGNIDLTALNNAVAVYENGEQAVFTAEKTEKISDFSLQTVCKTDTDFTGMTAVFMPYFREIGEFVMSPFLSSRIGCYALIKLIKAVKADLNLTFVFTVKKNIGMKGAKAAAYGVSPYKAVVVDCFSGDDKPLLMVKDKSCFTDKSINDELLKCGFEPIVSKDGATEAGAVQTAAGGILTAAAGIGVKYINKPNEIASAAAIEKLYENLLKYVNEVCTL